MQKKNIGTKCFGWVASIGLLLASQFAFASHNLAQTATVFLKSEPGNWVGDTLGGVATTFTHGMDGLFYGNTNFNGGVSIYFDGGSGWNWFLFDFAAPKYDPITNTVDNHPLKAGVLYNNVQRYPFNLDTRPGMDISNRHGNSRLSGWFKVLDVAYGNNGDITRFAADFTQFGESDNSTGPALHGSLRFNSNIAINPVPEPETYMMFGLGLATLALVRRKRAKFH
ncbi:PEP-CTERM sorting domain-containing protein [Chitinimonas arctica]|uniref:PEP-CTERM sorting domain-containing protein n=1 Tax=Chitinimonas arctica TaxID=2594795 RepID=A0A516SA67_9NEIS|nr:PEP-CTERM sorting domain-containing protein [Chitinimonas arctica]QDQ25044.1 PEP-CTERM sorting domain-containing protein [Chitinimonas arctica]